MTNTRKRRFAGWGAVVLGLAAVFSWVLAAPAWAHNHLESTYPVDGRQLQRVPDAVVLTFNEPALAIGTKVVVTGPGGVVSTGDAQLVDNTVTQSIGAGAPAGSYQVAWRVTSADGHPITGQFTFTAAAPAEAAQSANSSRATATPSPGAGQSPAASPQGIPGWLWIVAGVLVVVFARPLAARLQGLGSPRDWFNRRRDRP